MLTLKHSVFRIMGQILLLAVDNHVSCPKQSNNDTPNVVKLMLLHINKLLNKFRSHIKACRSILPFREERQAGPNGIL